MRKIHKACKHSSVDKTMRILLEWYIAVLRGNPDMEFVVLGGTLKRGEQGQRRLKKVLPCACLRSRE